MDTINCPDCKKQVLNRAYVCPQCGYHIGEEERKKKYIHSLHPSICAICQREQGLVRLKEADRRERVKRLTEDISAPILFAGSEESRVRGGPLTHIASAYFTILGWIISLVSWPIRKVLAEPLAVTINKVETGLEERRDRKNKKS